MKSTQVKAERVISAFAGTSEYDRMMAVRAFCNSDSAFLLWVRRGADNDLARAARLIQQALKRLGMARSVLITLRAVKAAIAKLSVAWRCGKVTKREVVALLKQVGQKAREVGVSHGLQESLF